MGGGVKKLSANSSSFRWCMNMAEINWLRIRHTASEGNPALEREHVHQDSYS